MLRRGTSFGRVEPVSNVYGSDRGTPIDRLYIERFLERHRDDIRGRVLEMNPPQYTRGIGGDRVTSATVLAAAGSDQSDAICADLATANAIPAAAFDCFICTQTLQYVSDPIAACRNAFASLDTGGVLLLTVPTIARLDPGDLWPEYWRFTPEGVEHVLSAAGPWAELTIDAPGNVQVAAAFLYGLAAEELSDRATAHTDGDFPLLVTARAAKA